MPKPSESNKPYHGLTPPKKESASDLHEAAADALNTALGQTEPRGLKYPDGNPKTQFGVAKPGDWATPPIPYYEYSLAHLQGALKYGPFNWRDDPISMSTYIDAMERHIKLLKEGQDRASDTGIHHLGHIMTDASIVLDALYHGTLIDDRKVNKQNSGNILEKYLEDTQPLVKRIRQDWTGHAESLKVRSK